MASFPDGRNPPPPLMPGQPVIQILKAGSILWRVHAAKYGPTQFNPEASKTTYHGGRFDSLIDSDPYLYAGDSPQCAIAEVWDRDIGPGVAERLIPEATLSARRLSQLETQIDLPLINVSTPAASKFGQTSWFTNCDSFEYPHTRTWANWLRANALVPHSGFLWRSKRDSDRFSYVFYERQLPPGIPPFQLIETIHLQTGPGRQLVEDTMPVLNAAFATTD